MNDTEFEKWLKVLIEADLTLRQKERIAKHAWFRCAEYFQGQKIMKVRIRCEDEPRPF